MNHFGATLRLLRTAAGMGLRDLAERIGVSGAYISRIEHGHDPAPTPDRLVSIAQTLDIPAALLLELAGQTGPAVSSYVGRVPAAGALFMEIAKRNLTAPEIARVMAFMDREFPSQRAPELPSQVSDLLAKDRIVIGLECTKPAELVEIAVGLWPLPDQVHARDLVEKVLRREREAPSTIGHGLWLPHATVRGARPAAVLMTLAQPMQLATPDREPVRLAICLLSSEHGREHLNMLAKAVRLSRLGAAEHLAGLEHPARLLARLKALETN